MFSNVLLSIHLLIFFVCVDVRTYEMKDTPFTRATVLTRSFTTPLPVLITTNTPTFRTRGTLMNTPTPSLYKTTPLWNVPSTPQNTRGEGDCLYAWILIPDSQVPRQYSSSTQSLSESSCKRLCIITVGCCSVDYKVASCSLSFTRNLTVETGASPGTNHWELSHSTPNCDYCANVWTKTPNVGDSNSVFDSSTTDSICRSRCLSNPGCTGYDTEVILSSVYLACYLSLSSTPNLFSQTDRQHYDLLRNPCQTVTVSTSAPSHHTTAVLTRISPSVVHTTPTSTTNQDTITLNHLSSSTASTRTSCIGTWKLLPDSQAPAEYSRFYAQASTEATCKRLCASLRNCSSADYSSAHCWLSFVENVKVTPGGSPGTSHWQLTRGANCGVCSDVWALTPNVSDSYSTFDSLTRETECQTICVNSAYCVGFDLESIPGSTDVFKCYLSFSASSVLSSRTQFNHFDLIRNSCELAPTTASNRPPTGSKANVVSVGHRNCRVIDYHVRCIVSVFFFVFKGL